MSYKTILVQADGLDPVGPRIEIAAGIALAGGAHLIGVACADASAEAAQKNAADPGGESSAAAAALDRFDDTARKMGIASFERRLIQGDPAGGFSLQGRYCDLMVLGQGDGRNASAAPSTDFIQYVVINCACPVMVVPGAELRIGSGKQIGSRVLAAWNASTMSARAVRDAMPFLLQAKQVHVAIINAAPDALGDEPGADIALYLARHGIEVDVIRQTVDTDVGRALLSLADRLSCDLLVMGCAAHHRGRGLMLGGATRTVLESSHLPVLMSH